VSAPAKGESMNNGRHKGLRRLGIVLSLVLAATLAWGAVSALASSPSPAASPTKVVLKIGWTVEPDNLNPFIGWQNQDYEIWSINYSFLFGFGTSDKPTLDLASEFPTKQNGGLSADGKLWTIHLRPNLKWSDGQPLTAADVAFTYNYIIKNKMLNMSLATRGIISAKAVDPTTVQILCARPKADMMRVFIPILPQHVWSKVSPQAATTSFTNPVPIVGSGPFTTVEFAKGKFLRMERNPYYYGTKPAVDEIIFSTYTNPDSMTIDLKSGNIDAAWGIPVAQFKPLQSTSGIEAIAYPYYNWEYLNFNCYSGQGSQGAPVLKDWRFRNAINYAIDRQKLCAIAFDGYAQPGTTILPPKTWKSPDYHWQPTAGQTMGFDLAKAAQLLDQAGYPLKNGKRVDKQGKPITLRLYATTDNVPSQTEGKLIDGWFQQLGITVQYTVLDPGALLARIWNYKGTTYEPDFDMYINSWLGYMDPGQTLAAETTSQIGATNEPGWSNAQYDGLSVQQASQMDPAQRQQTIWQMQQIMYQQTPWVVVAYPDFFEAYDTAHWTGWTRVNDGNGPAFFTAGNVDSYVNLKPVATTTSAAGAGSHAWLFAVLAIVVVAVLAVVFLRRRSRGRVIDE
jgi:peptide/nickel transport system substrate-binding protein